jgi:hypothetical protein
MPIAVKAVFASENSLRSDISSRLKPGASAKFHFVGFKDRLFYSTGFRLFSKYSKTLGVGST